MSSSNASSMGSSVSVRQREINKCLVDARSLDALVDIIETAVPSFNAVNASTALHRMAKAWPEYPALHPSMQQRVDAVLHLLTQLAVAHVSKLQGQGLGIIVWACSKMGCSNRLLLEAFAQEAVRRLTGYPAEQGQGSVRLGAQALSNMLYGFAVLSFNPGPLFFSVVARGVRWQLQDFSPQGLSSIVWAYAKLGAYVSPEMQQLLEAMATEAVKQLMDVRCRHNFIPQNLSNLIYGYAVLGVDPGSMLLIAVAKEALRQLPEFGPQELTITVWSYARLHQPGQVELPEVVRLLDAAAGEMQRQLQDPRLQHKEWKCMLKGRMLQVRPQTISNCLWAFAQLQRKPEGAVQALCSAAWQHVTAFKPQELGNICWAFVKLGHYPEGDLLGGLAAAAHRQLALFRPGELINFVWGLASLRHHPGQAALEAIEDEACRHADKLSADDWCRMVRSLAMLGYQGSPRFLEAVQRCMATRAQGVAAVEVVGLIWGLSVMAPLARGTLQPLQGLASQLSLGSLDEASLADIFEAELVLGARDNLSSCGMLQPLIGLAAAAWCKAHQAIDLTQERRQLSGALSSLGLEHQLNVEVAGDAVRAQAAAPGPRVVFTFEGQEGFSCNPPQQPSGGTILKWKQLLNRGWKVVSIPVGVWQSMAGKPGDQASFVHDGLAAAATSIPELRSLYALHSLSTAPGKADKGMDALAAHLATTNFSGFLDSPTYSPPTRDRSPSQQRRQLLVGTYSDSGQYWDSQCSIGTYNHSVLSSRQSSLPGGGSRSSSPHASGADRGAEQPQGLHGSQGSLQSLLEQDGSGEPGEQHAASSHGHISHGLGRLSGIGAALPQSPSQGPGQGVGRGQAQGPWGPPKLPPQQQPDQGQGRKTLGDPSPWDDLAQSLPLQLRSLQEGPAGVPLASLTEDMNPKELEKQLYHPASGLHTSLDTLYNLLGALPHEADLPQHQQHLLQSSGSSWPESSTPDSYASPSMPPQSPCGSQTSGSRGSSFEHGQINRPIPAFGAPQQAQGQGQARGVEQQTSSGPNHHHPGQQPPPSRAGSLTSLSSVTSTGSWSHLPDSALGGSADKQGLGAGAQGAVRKAPPSATSSHSRAPSASGDLRKLWHQVTQVGPGQGLEGSEQALAASNLAVMELKRTIEALPLEKPVAPAIAAKLALLDVSEFNLLLRELAREQQAYRAWQLFDWVRLLPACDELRRFCHSSTYVTMIALCGTWRQLRRALELVADMRSRDMECGLPVYSALLHSTVKCNESELAVEVFRQMQLEGLPIDRSVYNLMVDVFVKMGTCEEAIKVLSSMHKAGETADTVTYNLLIVSATRLNRLRTAVDVYKRMVGDGVQPNTKTYTALIMAFSKAGRLESVLDVLQELVMAPTADVDEEGHRQSMQTTYAALMAACEKAGQWDLAVALFDKMSAQGCQPDVAIFNSMIAACAHGGEHVKARAMFDCMTDHGCQPDAVTYANLIRAFKKGGQWCHALDTFEAMQASGCRAHAAVYSSVIDVLWQTGIAWAQAKALTLFEDAIEHGPLDPALEVSKKGTLKLDLQALTVGVAVLSMHHWLVQLRPQLASEPAAGPEASRKLAVVNGMGENNRTQGNSSAVKEAVGASLIGCKAPFRLVSDHSRSGRLEASMLSLRKWLFSPAFDKYHQTIQSYSASAFANPPQGSNPAGQLISTADYLARETANAQKCSDMFEVICTYERQHRISLKTLQSNPGGYLQQRKQIVMLAAQLATALQLTEQLAHAAVSLLDRTMMTGAHMAAGTEVLVAVACLRIAALHEGAFVPTLAQVAAVVDIPGVASGLLEGMEANIANVLQQNTTCISPLHCLKLYATRLAVDPFTDVVHSGVSLAGSLLAEALGDTSSIQFPPSLLAAAALYCARRTQGLGPSWPSVLAALTSFSDVANTPFSAAIAYVESLGAHLLHSPATQPGLHMPVATAAFMPSPVLQQLSISGGYNAAAQSANSVGQFNFPAATAPFAPGQTSAQNYTSEAMLALLRGASEAQQQQRLHQLTPSADSPHTLYGAAP